MVGPSHVFLMNRSLTSTHMDSNDKNEKAAKKRPISWSQLLLPSYKSRLIEFRRLFAKSIPVNEKLIDDFSSALQKEILLQGRLFLSMNYLAFHANIFGWETVLSIKLCDITSITKANTIRFIPNAIHVFTNNGNKYIFTSFVARDKAFKRIYRLWQDVIIGQKMNISEVWQLIHYNYGHDLGVPSDGSDIDEEELNSVTRNNINIVEEEIDDEVFDETMAARFKPKRRESMSSFLTCPESELEEELNLLGSDVIIKSSERHNKMNKIFKLLKFWYKTSTRESIYLRTLLVLSLFLLLMQFILIYKLSKVDLYSDNNVNIVELKQLADLTSRLARDTDYSNFK